jgi:hypothetical protein
MTLSNNVYTWIAPNSRPAGPSAHTPGPAAKPLPGPIPAATPVLGPTQQPVRKTGNYHANPLAI